MRIRSGPFGSSRTCSVIASGSLVILAADVRALGRSQDEAAALPAVLDGDLQRMRLGLGTTLLDDGYFGFDRGDCLRGQPRRFEEYDMSLGQLLPGYRRLSDFVEQSDKSLEQCRSTYYRGYLDDTLNARNTRNADFTVLVADDLDDEYKVAA